MIRQFLGIVGLGIACMIGWWSAVGYADTGSTDSPIWFGGLAIAAFLAVISGSLLIPKR